MATTSKPLNPEPAAPEARAEQNLPPKSYATAATESAPQSNDTNGDAVKQNGSTATNLNGTDDAKIVYEKYVDEDGDYLTSVRTQKRYEDALRHNKATDLREKEDNKKKQDWSILATGRRAGAGWEQSA